MWGSILVYCCCRPRVALVKSNTLYKELDVYLGTLWATRVDPHHSFFCCSDELSISVSVNELQPHCIELFPPHSFIEGVRIANLFNQYTVIDRHPLMLPSHVLPEGPREVLNRWCPRLHHVLNHVLVQTAPHDGNHEVPVSVSGKWLPCLSLQEVN
jgi:hypothetical protein